MIKTTRIVPVMVLLVLAFAGRRSMEATSTPNCHRPSAAEMAEHLKKCTMPCCQRLAAVSLVASLLKDKKPAPAPAPKPDQAPKKCGQVQHGPTFPPNPWCDCNCWCGANCNGSPVKPPRPQRKVY